MTKSTSRCGANTNEGKCRNKVSKPGHRCRLHRSLNGGQILSLCFNVTEKVAALCTVYDVLVRIHPLILPLVHSLHGLLMPEHFWLFGFEPKDIEAMRREQQKAEREAREVIEARYLAYSEDEKLRVERVYREILRRLEPFAKQI